MREPQSQGKSEPAGEGRMRRVFLGWDRPAFDSVVEYLERRYGEGPVWDLSRVVLVVPGGRAGRRLIERLVGRAEARQCAYFPPQVTTVGQLPELLYRRRLPFASNLTQQLAWTASLRHASPGLLQRFLRDVPPAADDPRWWELGSLLWRQHRELAADGLDFAQVARAGQALHGFTESDRWEALACVQRDYLARLDALKLWDRQTARLYAIEHGECETERDVLLVGTVDLNRSLRQMIDQVRQRVTALVYAAAEVSDAFDAYGCLIPGRWQTLEIPVRDEQIRLVDRPADQAAEVVRRLAESEGRYTASEITVGVPDESLVSLVQRQLAQAGVPSRYGPGRGWQASRPARLTRAIVQYLSGGKKASDLRDLLRHPDLVAWLLRREPQAMKDIAAFDTYCAERLVVATDPILGGGTHASRAAERLIGHVHRLLGPLEGPVRPPAEWVPPVLELLSEIYGANVCCVDVAEDRMIIGGCELLRDGLVELRKVPAELTGAVTATQAILMAMAAAAGGQIASPGVADAVEVLGWLELPLDDAPALIVTNLNEGIVPTSACADLFLPDRLRAHLGLDDNARRYARDAYALTVLARTREFLRLIVGRRDELGNPLLPSRLLFATDERRLGMRCRWFFSETSEMGGETDAVPTENLEVSIAGPSRPDATSGDEPPRHGFFVPYPRLMAAVERMNVTDFGEYLKCPYRYYLSRILKLESVTCDRGEMDGRVFGSLLHKVLGAFGTSDVRDSVDPEQIEHWLLETLDRVCLEHFGPTRLPAVQLQQEQMRWRLKLFAAEQSRWRAKGWRIVKSEDELSTVETVWRVDDADMILRGRVDRIDQHEDGRYAILDYKSSEDGKTPAETHLGGRSKRPKSPEDWVDLQLPIYRHFARQLELHGAIELGYITLPRSRKCAGFHLARWTAAELETADEAARRIVRDVREGKFWEPKHFDTCFDDGLDRICQWGVFDRQLEPLPADPSTPADCQGVAR